MSVEEAKAAEERETAPQSSYTQRQVGIGFLIFLIGSALVFGLPLVLPIT